MKKKILLLFIFVLCLMLVGCNESEKVDSIEVDSLIYDIYDDRHCELTNYNYSDDKLYEITLPEEVEYDGKSYKLTKICDNALKNCVNISSITLSDNIKEVGDGSFYYCSNLQSIILSKSVESIVNGNFYGCTNLSSIVVDEENEIYDSRDNCNAIINTEENSIIAACKETTFPTSVTTIGQYAFRGCYGLIELTIPETITKIESHVFHQCIDLRYIKLNNQLEEISNYTFSGCNSLVSVYLSKKISKIGIGAFLYCHSLDFVYYEGSEEEYNNISIYDSNDALTRASLIYENTDISLEHVSDTVNGWDYVIKDDTQILGLKCTNKDIVVCFLNEAFEGYEVYSIAYRGFHDCDELLCIILPSIKYIHACAFDNCTSLSNAFCYASYNTYDIGGSNDYFTSCSFNYPTGDVDIEYSSEADWYYLKFSDDEIIGLRCLNKDIVECDLGVLFSQYESISLSNYCFQNCTKLKNVIIPTTVKRIGNYTFNGCSSLESITLPFIGISSGSEDNSWFGFIFGAKSHQENQTYVPSTLKKVILTGSTIIASYAFFNCTSLEDVFIPSTIISVGEYAFFECDNLLIRCAAPRKPVRWNMNWNITPENKKVTVAWSRTAED